MAYEARVKGAPAKPMRGMVELATEQPDRIEDHRELLPRVEAPQGVDVGPRPERGLDDRSFSRLEIERDAERRQGKEEVAEEDRRVDAESTHRLQGDLDGQLGRPAEVEQAVLLPQGAVLGHVSPRLAHEPDRRLVDGLAAARAEEAVVHRLVAIIAHAVAEPGFSG